MTKEKDRHRALKRYYENPERSKAYHREYLKKRPTSYTAWLLCKNRAKKLGLPYFLDVS